MLHRGDQPPTPFLARKGEEFISEGHHQNPGKGIPIHRMGALPLHSPFFISLLEHNTFGYLDEDTVAFLADANPVYTPAHYSGTLIRTMEG